MKWGKKAQHNGQVPSRPKLGGPAGPATSGEELEPAPEPGPRRHWWSRKPEDDSGEQRDPGATGGDQVASTVTTKTISVALAVCLISGPAALGWAAWAGTTPDAVSAAPAAIAESAADRAAAEEMAQRVVVSWLTATSDEPEEFTALAAQARDVTFARKPQKVSAVRVSNVTHVGQDWSVEVAITVTPAGGEPQRRFFAVPVRVRGNAVTLLALPAPTTGPVIAAPPALDYPEEISSDPLILGTVEQFLGTYLAGAGDVSRYLTPGSDLAAITPPLFTEIAIDQLQGDREPDVESAPADGDTVKVLVTATGTVTKTQTATFTYALALTARDGRWEVTTIEASPAVKKRTADRTGTDRSFTTSEPTAPQPIDPAETP